VRIGVLLLRTTVPLSGISDLLIGTAHRWL
jgi:hypothetical protein